MKSTAEYGRSARAAGLAFIVVWILTVARLGLVAAESGPAGSSLPGALTNAFTNSIIGMPVTPVGYVPDAKYKLRAGDRVSFQILEDREAAKSLVIADSGELDAPYLGRIAAADKTCKQLGEEMGTLLEKDFYYHATVILSLDVANRFLGRVYVWGQVKNQGPLDIALNENITVGKAILRAGGFADFANRKRVKLVRARAGEPASRQVYELNMVEILDNGRTEKDLPLEPDDSIIVPSRLINF